MRSHMCSVSFFCLECESGGWGRILVSGPMNCIGSSNVCGINEYIVQWSAGFSLVLRSLWKGEVRASKRRRIHLRMLLSFSRPFGDAQGGMERELDSWQNRELILATQFLITQFKPVIFIKTTSYLWIFPHFRGSDSPEVGMKYHETKLQTLCIILTSLLNSIIH